jgi:hypothetical protein
MAEAVSGLLWSLTVHPELIAQSLKLILYIDAE